MSAATLGPIIAISVFVFIFAGRWYISYSRLAELKQFAREHGLEVTSERAAGFAASGEYRGIHVSIATTRGSSEYSLITRVTARLPSPLGDALIVRSNASEDQAVGLREIGTGDGRFDRRFRTRIADEESVRSWLTEEIREALLAVDDAASEVWVIQMKVSETDASLVLGYWFAGHRVLSIALDLLAALKSSGASAYRSGARP